MDLAENSVHNTPTEFIAVVLAGFGNELLPLTADHAGEPSPKALLPIANLPMISYVINWLDEAGIKDVLLICPTSHRRAISHHLSSDPSSSSLAALNIDIQTIDQSQEIPATTCTILKHFGNRIDRDFVVLPCDFVPPPSLKLSTLLNKFRIESTTEGALLTSLFFERQVANDKNAEESWDPPAPPTPILYDESTGTLLHVDSIDNRDKNDEELELRMGMLWKYPKTRLSANLIDSHVYVCKRAVLDVLGLKPNLDSFREEFVPWLCKLHTQKTKQEKYSAILANITNTPSVTHSLALQHSTLHRESAASEDLSIKAGQEAQRSSSAHGGNTAPSSPSQWEHLSSSLETPSLRCGLIVHRLRDGYAARASDLLSYLELNRISVSNTSAQSYDPSFVDPKSSISQDSTVGESSKIGERTSVKRSVIGKHCVIGKNVKIVGSVLMDHCVVQDGAKIEGSILCRNTTVRSKAEVIRCVSQAGFEVEAGRTYKHEKLDNNDWTAGGSDLSDEGSDSEDDDDEDEEESE